MVDQDVVADNQVRVEDNQAMVDHNVVADNQAMVPDNNDYEGLR